VNSSDRRLFIPRLTSIYLLAGGIAVTTVSSQAQPEPPGPPEKQGRPAMQPRGQQPPRPTTGPYTHKIQSASSQDGLSFTVDPGVLLEHASVPATVMLPDTRIRTYYVDASKLPETANVAESKDNGKTFQALGLEIKKMAKRKALDPAIVRLDDGRWRLYYYACNNHPEAEGAHEIHAAISSDGVHFTEEQLVFSRQSLVDPDVWWNGKEWLMYVFSPAEHDTIVARSKDGLNFTYVGPLGLGGWGTVAPIKLPDGRFRLFAFEQHAQEHIGSFISMDGSKWTKEEGWRLSVPHGKQITDPFVVRLPDNSWKMFFKLDEGVKGNPRPPDEGEVGQVRPGGINRSPKGTAGE